MKNLILLLVLLSFLPPSLKAQPNTDKVSDALSEFQQTEFMRKYSDLRIKAETEISAFRTNSSQYDPQDVARVQIAYDRTAQRFNGLLDKIKKDFLDTRKLKYITQYPDTYSRGLELDIRELSDFYSQNLQQTLADVTNQQQDGSALLLLLIDLVKFSSSAIQHFNRIRQESRRYTESYLNQHFVRPNNFKTWAQLSGGGYNDPYQPNTDPYADPYQQNTDPYNDPYQQNPNTNPYNDPYNQNQTNPYNDPYQQNPNTNPYADPYQQNQNTNPYADPAQQNPNTNPYSDPYQQQNNYGYDGASPQDSLKKDSIKTTQDSTIHFQKKPVKGNFKSSQAYEAYRQKQRARINQKKSGNNG